MGLHSVPSVEGVDLGIVRLLKNNLLGEAIFSSFLLVIFSERQRIITYRKKSKIILMIEYLKCALIGYLFSRKQSKAQTKTWAS